MPIILADTDLKKGPATVEDPLPPTVRWIEGKNVQRILTELSGSNICFVHFEDPALFADANRCLRLCVQYFSSARTVRSSVSRRTAAPWRNWKLW
ncbi:hypothetical protein [Pseudodesulfovibrio sp.]|uniref:hypothetical protein n=1 Tax=unclassified Pseudodesulfovibrio TaxID=2661612 RepID=UPI003B004A96